MFELYFPCYIKPYLKNKEKIINILKTSILSIKYNTVSYINNKNAETIRFNPDKISNIAKIK